MCDSLEPLSAGRQFNRGTHSKCQASSILFISSNVRQDSLKDCKVEVYISMYEKKVSPKLCVVLLSVSSH